MLRRPRCEFNPYQAVVRWRRLFWAAFAIAAMEAVVFWVCRR